MSSSKTSKGFVSIALVVVIVIIAGVAGYLVVNNRVLVAEQTPTPTSAPSQTKSTTPTLKDETASWKIYSSVKYGFEIKYPPTFVFDENYYGQVEFSVAFGLPYNQIFGSNHPAYKSAPSIGIKINRLGSSVTLDSYIRSLSTELSGVRITGEAKVAGVAAITTQSCGEGGACVNSVHVAHNNLVFTIIDLHAGVTGAKGSAPDIYAQAISTFKFTK